MKTTLQILFAILLSTSTYAQSTVNIQINHLLDGVQFEKFPVSMSDQEEYVLILDAEYTNLLKGIDVTSGLIIHGGTGEVVNLAENIANNVFSASSTTSTEDNELVNSFEIFPNPVTNGVFTILKKSKVQS